MHDPIHVPCVRVCNALSTSVSRSRSASGGMRPQLLTVALEGEDGVVLLPRNVAALRALFNLAHRLSDVLGGSWLYVVDVVNALDIMLASPHTTMATQQVGRWPRQTFAAACPAKSARS